MTSEELRQLTLEHAGDNHHVNPWDAGTGSGFLGGGLDGRGGRKGRFGRLGGAEATAQARSRRVRLNKFSSVGRFFKAYFTPPLSYVCMYRYCFLLLTQLLLLQC